MPGLLDARLLFFGGKGGVGKTTCSAAAALAASRQGKRVLLVSTDPAHSTADIFERPFGREEREVAPGLTGLEIDAEFEAARYLAEVKGQIARLFSPQVVREAGRHLELAAAMPGAMDVALFDRLTDIVLARQDQFDLVVFDTAPTGHTLRLLRMPELMTGWVHALSRRRREVLELQRAARGVPSDAVLPDPVLESLDRRAHRLEELRARLTRAGTAAFVFVLTPERLPIEETARGIRLLEEGGMHVRGLVVNRVLPVSLDGAFYQARRAQEQVYLDEIDRRFSGLPRRRIPQLESDVHGISALDRIAQHLLA